MSNQLSTASLSVANVQSISNTIKANTNSITSLSGDNSKAFVTNITSPIGSAVNDPVGGILNKVISRIVNVSTLAEKKVDDLTSQIEAYNDKNGSVQVIGNKIIITVNQADEAKAQVEKQRIDSMVSSIKTTLTILDSTISSLQSIFTTINILQNLLSIEQALLTINPVSKASFTLFKSAIKIVFLGDMLKSYSSLIINQLSQSELQLNQLLSRFMNLQVSINVQSNANQGIQTDPNEALDNLAQVSLGGQDITNQSNIFTAFNGKNYILNVVKYGDKQLVGQATDQLTGQLAIQTAPSFIESPDELISELKSILNS